jgi:hypothetical protein
MQVILHKADILTGLIISMFSQTLRARWLLVLGRTYSLIAFYTVSARCRE